MSVSKLLAPTLVYIRAVWTEYAYWTKETEDKNIRFWPLLTVPGGTLIFTGVTELGSGSTLLLAAFGLCLGAMEVSVGPTESVILQTNHTQSKHNTDCFDSLR